jgi:hypothetical protein
MVVWVTLKTKVSVNLVPAQPEDIVEMFFDKVKKGERVIFERDVTEEVIEVACMYVKDGLCNPVYPL